MKGIQRPVKSKHCPTIFGVQCTVHACHADALYKPGRNGSERQRIDQIVSQHDENFWETKIQKYGTIDLGLLYRNF